jgi:hypothetical protein
MLSAMEHWCETVAARESREFAALRSTSRGFGHAARLDLWSDRHEVGVDGDRPDLLGAF